MSKYKEDKTHRGKWNIKTSIVTNKIEKLEGEDTVPPK